MKTFNQLALVAALSLAGATAAHADIVDDTFVMQNALQGEQGVTALEFDISDVGNDAITEQPVTHVANDFFVDDYTFNLPETASGLHFSVAADLAPTAGVSFQSATLYTATGDFTYSFATMTFSPVAIQANGLTLGNGTYVVEITGTTLTNGGSYSGALFGETAPLTSAVPEPADAAMLVVGLGLMAGLARRRARKG